MKFFEDIVYQQKKSGYKVCGDTYLCERTENSTVFVLCDGVGSGVYANIAAITCANRLLELLRCGTSFRAACETVASSMHRARSEDIPFSAFSAARIYPDGQFKVYTYEAPEAIIIGNGRPATHTPRFYTAGYEVIGEVSGVLDYGDSLVLCSDGVTQAGLGHGHGFGIGTKGITGYINRHRPEPDNIRMLPQKIVGMCAEVSEGRYEDDTTLAIIHCREASKAVVLSGPPSNKVMDNEYVDAFIRQTGAKIVCGSTTTDIVCRELGKEAKVLNLGNSFGAPPSYFIEGIDLATEGAIMLNQVYNILDEPPELFVENTVVEQFCTKLKQSDFVHFMIGNALNEAHEALLFKQVGVRVRKHTINLIADKLRQMGKLVVETFY